MGSIAERLLLHRAARVVDGAGVDSIPGVLLVRGSVVVAAGSPQEIGSPAEAEVVVHPGGAILPALGNAHAHLDLSAIEPMPVVGDFPAWLLQLRNFRAAVDPDTALQSLVLGAELSLRGGVALIGDILGRPLLDRGASVLETMGLSGVAFVEVFGAGRSEPQALAEVDRIGSLAGEGLLAAHGVAHGGNADFVDETGRPGRCRKPGGPAQADCAGWGRMRLGAQPHAPYSTTAAVFAAALGSGLPVSMHLAESSEEVAYCLEGTGPLRRLLEEVGALSSVAPTPVLGLHPVAWYCRVLSEVDRAGATRRPPERQTGDRAAPAVHRCQRGAALNHRAPRLAVHLEELPESMIEMFASSGATAVYCPRASQAFGRRGMPWRALRAAGVRVALGTDGRLLLDTPDRISTLDEMRALARRDGAGLKELLPMATTEVALALGVDPAPCTLSPGSKPGVLLVECGDDPRSGVLARNDAPRWLFGPTPVHGAGA